MIPLSVFVKTQVPCQELQMRISRKKSYNFRFHFNLEPRQEMKEHADCIAKVM